jgi:prepilin-type processing-associated H-X9-DG protein
MWSKGDGRRWKLFSASTTELGMNGSFADTLGLGGIAELNQKVLFTPKSIQESTVRAPADMLAIADDFSRSVHPALDGRRSLDYVVGAGGLAGYLSPLPKSSRDHISFKTHRGRFNRVFCDGHVEAEDFDRPYTPTDEYLRRWNNDHEAHRDRAEL